MNQAKLRSRNLFLGLLRSVVMKLSGDENLIDIFFAAVKYNVIEIDKNHAYNVYKIRRNVGNRELSQLKEFDVVLSSLLNHSEERVLIHTFYLGENVLMFFTDLNLDQVLGYITLGQNQQFENL